MKRTSWSAGLLANGDYAGVAAHAGTTGQRLLADRTGLTAALTSCSSAPPTGRVGLGADGVASPCGTDPWTPGTRGVRPCPEAPARRGHRHAVEQGFHPAVSVASFGAVLAPQTRSSGTAM
jgi:hypothetical protein